MPRRWFAGVLGCGLGVGAQAAELHDCRAVRPVDAAGARVVGVEDIARDPARDRLILSAYDRRAIARALRRGRPPPEGGLYALPLARLAAGEVRVGLLPPRALPPGGLRPHGLAIAGDRLAVVNRTVAAGRIVPVVDRFVLRDDVLEHETRLSEPRLCRPNDVAFASGRRLLVTNDHGACGGLALWWERIANRPWSFVMAFENGAGSVAAAGFRFANGVAVTADGPVVAATRGRRLVRLAADGRVPAPLPFAPDNLVAAPDGRVWAAGPVSLWRYAAFRAGWLASPGPSGVARWRPKGAPAAFTVPPDGIKGATVAVPVGDRLVLGAAYDDHLLLCARPR
jgi:sugar lactone lactonase YvrE